MSAFERRISLRHYFWDRQKERKKNSEPRRGNGKQTFARCNYIPCSKILSVSFPLQGNKKGFLLHICS